MEAETVKNIFFYEIPSARCFEQKELEMAKYYCDENYSVDSGLWNFHYRTTYCR